MLPVEFSSQIFTNRSCRNLKDSSDGTIFMKNDFWSLNIYWMLKKNTYPLKLEDLHFEAYENIWTWYCDYNNPIEWSRENLWFTWKYSNLYYWIKTYNLEKPKIGDTIRNLLRMSYILSFKITVFGFWDGP